MPLFLCQNLSKPVIMSAILALFHFGTLNDNMRS